MKARGPGTTTEHPCWSCGAQQEEAGACLMCGAEACFGSAPALINQADDLVRQLDGVLAHMENSARKHGATALATDAWAARTIDTKAMRRAIDKMRESLRTDGNKRTAA